MISSLHKVKVKNDIFFFKEKGGSVNFSNTEESKLHLETNSSLSMPTEVHISN